MTNNRSRTNVLPSYSSPEVKVLELKPRRVMCQSDITFVAHFEDGSESTFSFDDE